MTEHGRPASGVAGICPGKGKEAKAFLRKPSAGSTQLLSLQSLDPMSPIHTVKKHRTWDLSFFFLFLAGIFLDENVTKFSWSHRYRESEPLKSRVSEAKIYSIPQSVFHFRLQ